MTVMGLVAGVLTTACWLPQLVRSWRTRSTRDFSWLYLIVLTVGVSLWAVYGILRADVVIMLANLVTVCFLLFLLVMKLGETGRATSLPADPGSAR
jgi:MtN3 and saliva related transmembrane protein